MHGTVETDGIAGGVPPLPKAQRRPLDGLAIAGLSAVGAGAGILFSFDPARYGFYPICYLHAVTGLNCPGCGSLRAIHQLLHGHFAAAADLNLLLVLCLPFSAWWVVRQAGAWLYGQPRTVSIQPVWFWAFLAVCTVFTVLRNLPAFEWLAP